MDSEYRLVRKAKRGEPAAVDTLVRKHYEKVLSYCRYHTKDTHTAEDLTQETFMGFFRNLRNYEHEGKLLNYLYTLARNNCNDEKKRKRNTEIALDNVIDRVETESEHSYEAESEAEAVVEAVKKLPDDIREVVWLYYFEEKKVKERAGICDISLPNCKYRLRRGREIMRKIIEESGWRE